MSWMLQRPAARLLVPALLGLAAAACDAGRSELLAADELTEQVSAARAASEQGAATEQGAGAAPVMEGSGGGALEEMDAGVLGFFTPILAGPGMDSYSTRCDPYDDDAFTCL